MQNKKNPYVRLFKRLAAILLMVFLLDFAIGNIELNPTSAG